MCVNLDTSEDAKPEGTTEVTRSIIHIEEAKSGFMVSLVMQGHRWEIGHWKLWSDKLPLFEIPSDELEKTIARFDEYPHNIHVNFLLKDEGGAETT